MIWLSSNLHSTAVAVSTLLGMPIWYIRSLNKYLAFSILETVSTMQMNCVSIRSLNVAHLLPCFVTVCI